MSSDIVIDAHQLGKSYSIYKKPQDRLKQALFGRWETYHDTYWALGDVSFCVPRGQTLGIIGRNGSGKSTLLQLITGTIQPTKGHVRVNGRVAALLELGAGFNPEFTGRENIYVAAGLLGLSTEQINARLEDIIAFAAIGDFLDQPVKLYSSGMYARLAFAVAAHVDADILIVDEILSVGDVAFAQKCMRFIRQFKEKGTLLFVSHDTAAVINLCDTVAWMDRGRLREFGPAKEVCRNYLVAMEAEKDDSSSFKSGGRRQTPVAPPPPPPTRDVRAEMLANSTLRNEIELFDFDPQAPWHGVKDAEIQRVALETPTGEILTTLVGGEDVVLRMHCHTTVDLDSPIGGFRVNDRLGQFLFGDNTFLVFKDNPAFIPAGSHFTVSFHFNMPYLPSGDYSIVVALVNGTQWDYVNHHWIEDAMFFRVHSSHVARGLVGIPMQAITIRQS